MKFLVNKPSEIPSFLEEVSYLDPSSLEVAWELLVEEGETVNPSQMATLLFSAHPELRRSLLVEDKLYFKQRETYTSLELLLRWQNANTRWKWRQLGSNRNF